MARRREMQPWFGVFFLGIGLFMVLLSLGVIPYVPPARPRRRAMFDDPHHWQLTSAGVAFMCAGISIAFQRHRRWLLMLNGLVLLACLDAPLGWLLFVSGAVTPPMQVVGGLVLGLGVLGSVAGLVQTARGKQPPAVAGRDPMH